MKATYLIKTIIVCAIAAITAGSCKKTVSGSTFSRADIPTISIGSWWRYRVVDSMNNTTDTLTISVLNTHVGTNHEQVSQFYVQRYGVNIDSGYFFIADTYLSFEPSVGYLPHYVIALPFTAGDRWSISVTDSIQSLSYQVQTSVLSRSYMVYDLTRNTVVAGTNYSQHFQLAKGIGMVREQYFLNGNIGDFTHPFSAELIDYHF